MIGMDLEQRFWKRVKKNGPVVRAGIGNCWAWTGARLPDGRGVIKEAGKMLKAYRVAWEIARGSHPGAMCVCHHCDNPNCVNPDHLFLGTNDDNMADMKAKGRASRGERSRMARVSAVEVKRIRELWRRGECSQYEIARRFGIAQQNVSSIVQRRTWAHID